MTTPKTIAEAFLFCPSCGVANPNPGVRPYVCAQCGHANFFGPVAAVGGLILNDANELLLVQRAKDPGLGKWGLPGGFVDPDESIEVALAREVMEETGLQLASSNYLVSFPNSYNYRGVIAPVIDLFYLAKLTPGQQVSIQVEELSQFRWAPAAELAEVDLAFQSNRRAINVWLEQA